MKEGKDEILGSGTGYLRDPKQNPFAFSPGQLNKIFNPKSLAAYHSLGGLGGLEKGLRTNCRTGLSSDEKYLAGAVSFEEVVGKAPSTLATEGLESPRVSMGTADEKSGEPFADRKRVFSDNRLPEKRCKSLIQLTWDTYNDRVLILLTIAAVVFLALPFYQKLGMADKSSQLLAIECVEGMCLIGAIVIVVIAGAWKDWQKGRQFVKFSAKKADRYVKVIRSGMPVEISVLDVMCGDVLFLEPGDLIPVDGILIEGFNVKCDESGTKNELGDIKTKRPVTHSFLETEDQNCIEKLDPFIQSGARVLEGVGTCLVTSTGVYSVEGKIEMRLEEDRKEKPQARITATIAAIFKAVSGTLLVAITRAFTLANGTFRTVNLARHLKACETMGDAISVCSDGTGTLKRNKMRVVAGVVGTSHQLGDVNYHSDDSLTSPASFKGDDFFGTTQLPQDVKDILIQSIALNSTAFEGEMDGEKTFIGSKTEVALLTFARDHLQMGKLSEERASAEILHHIPFDSRQKCMGMVTPLANGKARLYLKGASEVLLGRCSEFMSDPLQSVSTAVLTESDRMAINDLVNSYASDSLRTIGMAYRDFESWPPRDVRSSLADDSREVPFEDISKDLTFIGVTGIRDPLRSAAMSGIQNTRVTVRSVPRDGILTARQIATECGIVTPEGATMEGPEFRRLSPVQQDSMVARLQVLARASPEDKRTLVRNLREKGDIIVVNGDTQTTLAMYNGISGNKLAKEASDFILMDDNFDIILKALHVGGTVNQAVMQFLTLHHNIIKDPYALATHPLLDETSNKKRMATTTIWPLLRKKNLQELALAWVAFSYCSPLVAAVVLSHIVTPLRIGSGVSAAGSAIAVIPLRTIEGVPSVSWIILYVLWAVCFSLYLWMQHMLLPHNNRYKRKMFLFCVILATVHFSIGVSAQSETTISDGFTVYGPIIATVSVYLMALLFASKDEEGGQTEVEPTPALTTFFSMCG